MPSIYHEVIRLCIHDKRPSFMTSQVCSSLCESVACERDVGERVLREELCVQLSVSVFQFVRERVVRESAVCERDVGERVLCERVLCEREVCAKVVCERLMCDRVVCVCVGKSCACVYVTSLCLNALRVGVCVFNCVCAKNLFVLIFEWLCFKEAASVWAYLLKTGWVIHEKTLWKVSQLLLVVLIPET